MKRILSLALCVGAFLHSAQISRYSATTGDVSLSGAGTSFTIQQPATNGKDLNLEIASVYCSVACNVTQSQNGAAATATSGTISSILPTPLARAASATVWTGSNVGGGTAAGGIIHVPAGSTVTIDLSKVALGNNGAGNNYTVTVSSITPGNLPCLLPAGLAEIPG